IAYQSEGIKIELFNYDREGNINIIYTYYYNKYGNIYKEFQSTKDGKIIGKYEFEYSYWN
ncbi:MAG: cytochrome P450, partial [Candidatus Kapabacteria bacterium]|nr:cytochrome P450 [Candidatus Kapabacteria bacterium]